MNQADQASSLIRYDRFVKKGPAGAGARAGSPRIARLRSRYDVVFAPNASMFQGARVLDMMSGSGFWSLAAHRVGATHVTGIESLPGQVEAAKTTFSEDGIDAAAYRFVRAEVPTALRNFEPNSFDVVLCHGFLEQSDPRFFFQQMHRLKTRFVVLDTSIVKGKGPIVRLRNKPAETVKGKPASRYSLIQSVPNHELITFFSDYFQFRWRLIDWKTAGVTDWAGLSDYEQDHRRTYVLERMATDGPDIEED